MSDGPPMLPYVIPIPATGRPPGGLTNATSSHPIHISSAHDLGQQAKWRGFYQTLQRIAELKLAKSDELVKANYQSSIGGGSSKTHGDFPGSDYVYESPLNALGQADIPTPIGNPVGGLVTDPGRSFL